MNRLRHAINDALVLDTLEDLSASAEAQHDRWYVGIPGEIHMFGETASQLFDDTGLGVALSRGEQVYDPDIDDRLKKLNSLVGSAEDTGPGFENSHAMSRIRAEARSLLSAISERRHRSS